MITTFYMPTRIGAGAGALTCIDGVVCIGGGSVMCTGKGIAIVATNRKPMRDCTGVGQLDRKALPMIWYRQRPGQARRCRNGRS